PANISVPNVVGLAQAQAEMDITGAGLVVGSVTLQADVNVAPGNVISQSPDAMTLAAAATPVDLVVSAGPDAVPVPDIVGLTETEANTVVVNAGLAIGNVTVEFSTTIDRGDVISQSLQPGALVLPDTPLDFVVSAGPPVNVPNVIGLARAAAESALTNLNLAVGTVTEVFDLNVPLGNVISQDPGAGTVVPEDTTVDLVISLGPPPVNVPNVVGLAEAQARATLTSNRLTIGNVSLVFSNTVAAGLVISQDPAAGVSVPDSSPVDLVVSNGPPPVPAPNVVGLTQAAATTALNNAGLVVGTVTTQFSSTVAAGDVISQNPASGTVVAVGSAVDLVVSDGPAPVNVPNVVGLSQALATTNITNAGLVVGTVSTQSSNTVPDGDVISQNPASGTSVAAGSSVDLVVSSGPASVTVPNVVGLSQAQASADLTALGLVVGTVSNQSSATVPSGDVISQNPASGASVANGSAVDLVVSSGPASAFSDEFNSNSIADWSLRHVVEGSASQYTVLDINQSATGRLVIVPINTDGWFDGDDAPLVFKNITGNFAVQTRVLADSRTNPGNPPSDNFNSAGIMARNATGASSPENYVMVNLGKQRGNSAPADQRLGAESKTTVNSNSTLTIYNGSNEGDLILCRIGNEIRTYRFLTSDAGWTFMDSFDRSDLPATLQVGLVVSAFGGDDLRAEFDYVRLLATPTVAADCTP
ncbi:MAG: PASTA domain-containing protein, partial [Pseudomonadota bacterium]